jgi:hypothetical protein
MAASGVTATVGDDDIISMGGSNAEMAIHWLYPTTLSVGEAGKIWEVARKLPGSPFSIFSQLLPDS